MKKNKRPLTLLEIMIVILLIAIITSVIGYNMKGALEKGKAFRTAQAQEQLRDLLLLRLAEGDKYEEILRDVAGAVKRTGLAKEPENLVKDGWGTLFEVMAVRDRSDFRIRSKKLEQYDASHGKSQTDSNRGREDEDE
jgi:type II secretory pathway pseudopilin PulG